MGLQDLIITRPQLKPPRIVIHGLHGIGKSTMGASANNPIFLPIEDGLGQVDVPHFPLIRFYDDFMSHLKLLEMEKHNYKTVVIDTVDWLETLIWDMVCGKQGVASIEDIGYAKGYIFALRYWEDVITRLNILRDKGMIILLLAHNEIKTFNAPDGDNYDRYQVKLHHKAASKLQEWADAVLFATYKVYVNKDSKKATKGKGVGTGERVVYTEERPAHKAKNRYSMPYEMPFEWEAIISAIRESRPPRTEQPEPEQPELEQKEVLL